MKLYDFSPSPSPRRVRIFLAEKGIEIPTVQVALRDGEQFSEEFQRINPRGVVPVLELDDGTRISEAGAICTYIEASHPEPPLMGTSPVERAQVEMWNRMIEMDGFCSVRDMLRNTSPRFIDRALPGFESGMPQIPALAERGRTLLLRIYETLDKRLAEREFLVGERYSIADITLQVTVDFARWVKEEIAPEQQHLLRWYAAVAERPSASA